MCFDPVTGTALALAAAGAGAYSSYQGNKQADKATAAAYMQERQRQQGLTAKQNTAFDDSLRRLTEVAGTGTDAATDARRAAYTEAVAQRAPTQDYLPGSGSANQVVADNSAKAATGVHDDVAKSLDAQARLSGLGDSLFGMGVQNSRNAQQIGQLGSFKAGSANVLPAELEAASYKGSGLRSFGTLASMLGNAGLGYYLPGTDLLKGVKSAKDIGASALPTWSMA